MTKEREQALSLLKKAQKISGIRYVVVSQRQGERMNLTAHGFNHAYIKDFSSGAILPQKTFFGFQYFLDAMRVENIRASKK